MFDTEIDPIGLSAGEGTDLGAVFAAEDQLAFQISSRELADGWTDTEQHWLPDRFEDLPMSFLAVLVDSVDRSRLNGHDAVRLMQAEARLEASYSARKHASAAEVACSPPGDAGSPVQRCPSELEYAAVEIATALTLTRRAGEALLNHALSLTDHSIVCGRCSVREIAVREGASVRPHPRHPSRQGHRRGSGQNTRHGP